MIGEKFDFILISNKCDFKIITTQLHNIPANDIENEREKRCTQNIKDNKGKNWLWYVWVTRRDIKPRMGAAAWSIWKIKRKENESHVQENVKNQQQQKRRKTEFRT